MADYKKLCAELAEDLALWLEYAGPPSRLPQEEDESCQLLARARAALAEPEPERPTDEELSPAAQAVLDAFIGENTIYGLHLMTPKLAAALRAVAERGETFYWNDCPVQAVTVGSLLTIADQLEAS